MSGGVIVPASSVMADHEIQFGRLERAATTDLLADIKRQLHERREMLQAYRDEYDEIVGALNRLEDIDEPKLDWPVKRPRKVAKSQTIRKRPVGRPKGTGPRQGQVVELLQTNPGLSAAKVAEMLRIDRPQAHNILKKLEANGQARHERGNKKAARWYLVEQAS